jgi:hypothetical protein
MKEPNREEIASNWLENEADQWIAENAPLLAKGRPVEFLTDDERQEFVEILQEDDGFVSVSNAVALWIISEVPKVCSQSHVLDLRAIALACARDYLDSRIGEIARRYATYRAECAEEHYQQARIDAHEARGDCCD